jgi:hypothetical protein
VYLLHSRLPLCCRLSFTSIKALTEYQSPHKMAWQPQEAPLRELAGYLKDSLGSDKDAMQHATQVCGFPLVVRRLFTGGFGGARGVLLILGL